MKFFIDTADIGEIKQAKGMGVIDGVTTNPTLVARTGKDFDSVVKEILAEVDGPVSLEVTSLEASGMIEEAKNLVRLGKQVVIKIPTTVEGLKAIAELKKLNIKTNATLCFSANQAMLVAKAGATYVSPFVGRLDDISHTGMGIVNEIITIYENYGFETEVIVASVRSPIHVKEAALMGADIATIPFKVIAQLINHTLTDIGIEKFLKDWEKVPKS